MALTQEQWFEKIKGFVPTWVFENERLQVATFQALAKLLATAHSEMELLAQETYIAQADAYLDLHGSERSVARLEDEEDAPYALRIRYITNTTNKVVLKQIIDALLLVGTCEIREGMSPDNIFTNRSSFLNRNEFYNDYHYNVFTVVIDKQVHPPYSFLSRGNYLNREDFIGSSETGDTISASLQAAIDSAKAAGIMYKIVERH